MENDKALRQHLIDLLRGGQAYEKFEDVAAEFSAKERGRIPNGAEHSAWQIVDHMIRALDDIVEFSDNAKGRYREKDWPADYWAKERLGDWDASIKTYQKSRRKMEALIKDEKRNLFAAFPWGNGQTLLREALLAADHQAYHTGELVELKRWLAAR